MQMLAFGLGTTSLSTVITLHLYIHINASNQCNYTKGCQKLILVEVWGYSPVTSSKKPSLLQAASPTSGHTKTVVYMQFIYHIDITVILLDTITDTSQN